MLKVSSPTIQDWKISAHQKVNHWILPQESDIEFHLENMRIDFNTELEPTETGMLKPILWATDIYFGNTSIYHDNFFLAIIFDQWIKLLLVIIQNSVYFLGDQIFNGMIEPSLSEFMNYYQVPLGLDDFFPGQSAHADFFLDMRH
jgi:hypothetical protein